MYKLVVIFVALAVTGCGRAVDPELQPYVDSFVAEALAHGRYVDTSRITAHFTAEEDLKSPLGEVVGSCNEETREVSVRQSYFRVATPEARENLMWHELGHCVLGRLHRLEETAPGEPVSVMYPTLLVTGDFTARRSTLAAELFAGTGPFFGPPLP